MSLAAQPVGMQRVDRLRSPGGFAAAYRTGERARSRSLTTIAAITAGTRPLIGVTCSRRVGGAVVRNRIKRRLRHAVAPFVGDLEAGVVVVLQGSLSARTEPFEALQAEILDGLRRTGAVRG